MASVKESFANFTPLESNNYIQKRDITTLGRRMQTQVFHKQRLQNNKNKISHVKTGNKITYKTINYY